MFIELAITILTFNLRNGQKDDGQNNWEFRREACVETVMNLAPDFVGFQENTLPQDTFIAANLPLYDHVAVGREVDNPVTETNAIYYRRDRYELVVTRSFWLSETPDVCSRGWDAKYPRIATYVVVRDRQSGEQYMIVNTHLDHRGEQARYQSMQLVADTIEALGKRYPNMPTFLLGDMNVKPLDPALLPVRQTMLSAQETMNDKNTPTFHGWGKEKNGGKVIDYIFYRNTYPTDYHVVSDSTSVPYLSDHYPVLGTFLSANEVKTLSRPIKEQHKLVSCTTDALKFNRYAAQNDSIHRLMAADKKVRTTVIFYGNSITQNWYKYHPEFFHENGFLGRGIGGQTSEQLLARFREDVLDLQPRVVMIMVGTNDIARNGGLVTQKHTMDNIISMCELARLHGVKPVLCSVLPARRFRWNRQVGNVPEQIRQLNAAIRAYADANKIIYVDYYSAMVDTDGGLRTGLHKDEVHPTKEGYLVMEPIALQTLRKLRVK